MCPRSHGLASHSQPTIQVARFSASAKPTLVRRHTASALGSRARDGKRFFQGDAADPLTCYTRQQAYCSRTSMPSSEKNTTHFLPYCPTALLMQNNVKLQCVTFSNVLMENGIFHGYTKNSR